MASSTSFISDDERSPSLRISFTRGTVTILCALKAPAFRMRFRVTTSYCEPRIDVVWPTTVTKALSESPAGTLITTHGRTFAVRPRSTNQTSPRLGTITKPSRLFQVQGINCRLIVRNLRPSEGESPNEPSDVKSQLQAPASLARAIGQSFPILFLPDVSCDLFGLFRTCRLYSRAIYA